MCSSLSAPSQRSRHSAQRSMQSIIITTTESLCYVDPGTCICVIMSFPPFIFLSYWDGACQACTLALFWVRGLLPSPWPKPFVPFRTLPGACLGGNSDLYSCHHSTQDSSCPCRTLCRIVTEPAEMKGGLGPLLSLHVQPTDSASLTTHIMTRLVGGAVRQDAEVATGQTGLVVGTTGRACAQDLRCAGFIQQRGCAGFLASLGHCRSSGSWLIACLGQPLLQHTCWGLAIWLTVHSACQTKYLTV